MAAYRGSQINSSRFASRASWRRKSGESLTASRTFFAAEHLSTFVASAAICTRSSTSIWPILNLVTRMPVMMASLCLAFLANFFRAPSARTGVFVRAFSGGGRCSNSLSLQPLLIYTDYINSLPCFVLQERVRWRSFQWPPIVGIGAIAGMQGGAMRALGRVHLCPCGQPRVGLAGRSSGRGIFEDAASRYYY